jgi:ketosteroid isomerase-like protein
VSDTSTSTRDPELQRRLDIDAIRDALMRYCRGVDRLDADIISSVYHPDAHDDHAGRIFNGETVGQGLVDWMLETMDATSHNITNSIVEVDGDTAGSEAYTTSMHLHTVDGEQRLMLALARYVDRFERRHGEWKIIDRLVVPDFTADVDAQVFDFLSPGRRDRTDPSYSVLSSRE